MKIVLASQSPRRRELLGQMGLTFTIQSPDIDEASFAGLPPQTLVTTLSREKALRVARDHSPDTLVIAADTVVVLDGTVLSKPADAKEAAAMLTALSGRSHEVYTGVTTARGRRVLSHAEVTEVTFRPLTEEEIAAYIRTGEPMDKAGAYGIQGLAALFVEGIRGDYANVVGLPVHRLGRMLSVFGVDCLALAAEKAP